jgi:hypothetical protein
MQFILAVAVLDAPLQPPEILVQDRNGRMLVPLVELSAENRADSLDGSIR